MNTPKNSDAIQATGAPLGRLTTSAFSPIISRVQCFFSPQGSFVLQVSTESVDANGDRGEIGGISLVVRPTDTVETVFRRVLKKRFGQPFLPYRPGVSGTWLAVCKAPIAVVADGWNEPKFIVVPSSSAQTNFSGKAPVFLHFYYLSDLNPDFVFENATTDMFARYV